MTLANFLVLLRSLAHTLQLRCECLCVCVSYGTSLHSHILVFLMISRT